MTKGRVDLWKLVIHICSVDGHLHISPVSGKNKIATQLCSKKTSPFICSKHDALFLVIHLRDFHEEHLELHCSVCISSKEKHIYIINSCFLIQL
jgi:hypothetical protein